MNPKWRTYLNPEENLSPHHFLLADLGNFLMPSIVDLTLGCLSLFMHCVQRLGA